MKYYRLKQASSEFLSIISRVPSDSRLTKLTAAQLINLLKPSGFFTYHQI
jgi:hypothetical protein